MEEHAYILDYLPQGRLEERRFKREPIAYGLGDKEFKLLELIVKPNAALTIGDRVYIGKDVTKREAILHVRRRVRYEDLTHAAQSELPYIILEIVKRDEERFIKFYNEARPITTRFHMLELLPGLGKKTMWAILEERKKGPFKSFKDLEERIDTVHHPEKFIAKRIELELSEPDQKYKVFVVK